VGVGSVNNTFGIQGVKEYCYFFKSIEDAKALRRRVSECFERAALPAVRVVVCGGWLLFGVLGLGAGFCRFVGRRLENEARFCLLVASFQSQSPQPP